MIVYAASDLHGNLPPVPPDAELLLLAGDICPDFGPLPDHTGFIDDTGILQANWLNTEFREWLGSVPCRVVATWGNHDFVGQDSRLVPDLPWTLLIDREVIVPGSGGLRIWGTPWVPNLPRWAFNASEEALAARAQMIPKGLDILMSHGPPYGFGDFIPGGSKYGNVGEEHVGDSSLNDTIKRAQPRFIVCGHIHESRGWYHIPLPRSSLGYDQECIVVNAAAVDGLYDLYEHPFTRIYGL